MMARARMHIHAVPALRWAALTIVSAILVLLALAPARADVPRRVALLVANGAYVHAGSLKNPVNDANLVAGSLREAGFQIVEANPNLGIGPFRDALRRFRSNAVGAQVALVYYAGHGIEARGKNWLIPTDAMLQQDADLDYEAIDLDLVLSATEGAEMRIVILDACRNNPFGQTWHRTQRAVGEGLAPIDVDDVLVIYSAAPGQTAMDGRGANSPFAEALAKRLTQPGLPIQMLGGMVRDDVLRATGEHQRPFISASITGTPFMLVPGAGSVAQAAGAMADDPKSMEMMYWQTAAAGDDVGQLRAYLTKYPNGNFAELAKARIASLEKASARPMANRDMQPAASVDPRALELAFWTSVAASNDIAQLTAYIEQYPNGQFVRAARAKIAALGRPTAQSATAGANVRPQGGVGYTAPVNAATRSAPSSAPMTNAYATPTGRFGASDDYMCNHGDPSDPRTTAACKRLRGDAQPP